MSYALTPHGDSLHRFQRPLAHAWQFYLLLVVYGSLVPFEWRPHTVAEAWQMFMHLPYLRLGVVSRADWVANIVLYVPLAFLASASLAGARMLSKQHVLRAVLVWGGCVAAAIGVEFTQLFFAPRTVSINDLAAEFIGSAVGVALWMLAGRRVVALAAEVVSGGGKLLYAAAVLYALAYLLLSLFPYDFLVSRAEILAKFRGDRYALLFVGCDGHLRCAAKLVIEMLAVVPLGLLLGMVRGRAAPGLVARAAAIGVMLGLGIEGAQLLLASGVSQGLSILTRAMGVAAGAVFYLHLPRTRWEAFMPWVRPLVFLGVIPYVIVLALMNGWFSQPMLDWGGAWERLQGISFMPFYYHYYTSEAVALSSLLANVALYLPVGWARGLLSPGAQPAYKLSPRDWRAAAVWGASVAFLAELGKLFLSAKHPDPTNILIGGAAAAAGCWMVGLALRAFAPSEALAVPAAPPNAPSPAITVSGAPRQNWPLLAIVLAGATAFGATHYPVGALVMVAGLLLYGALLWRWPHAWLFVIPAVIPVVDLAPWSGWLLVDELDLVLLVTVAMGLLRGPVGLGGLRALGVPLWPLAALGMSYVVSAVVGLWPLDVPDANALYSYHTHYNSLRLAKGFFWVLCLAAVIPPSVVEQGLVRRYFLPGVLTGLAGLVAAALWQRHIFVGLVDVTTDFRITATISGMHTGGAYIEAYLVLALPVVLWWLLSTTRWSARLAALALLSAGAYVLGVTYSRGGYLGFAVALSVMGLLYLGRRQSRIHLRAIGLGVLAILGIAAVTAPVLLGTYAQSRLARIAPDLETRSQHWREVWGMMDASPGSQFWGMGLGRFPQAYLWQHPGGAAPATYRYLAERGNTYLRLGSGGPVYLGQRVTLAPGQSYHIALDIRSRSPGAAVAIPICEKALIYSFRCTTSRVGVNASQGRWEHHELDVMIPATDAARPMELALYNPVGDTIVDVDNVSLSDAQGGEQLINGDFARAGARWFFTSDQHLAWHEKSLYVHLLFEQGWIGLLAFMAFVGSVYARRLSEAGGGGWASDALLAALAGVLIIGAFDSLIDLPRFALLFYLSLIFAAAQETRTQPIKKRP